MVRFRFHNRGWVFAWGVAGRELFVQDGDSEDEQGVFAVATSCLPTPLALVLTACFFVPNDVALRLDGYRHTVCTSGKNLFLFSC
jgi:hypothetical protein